MEPFIETMRQAQGARLFTLQPWAERFPEITAGFTSRHGGVSSAPFDSLNCGLHVPDRDQDVIINRGLVAEAVGVPLSEWTYAEQVHGHDVMVVSAGDKGKGTLGRDTAIAGKDAFITEEPGICMAALFADCVPLYFYDPVRKAAGLAHAGWKGTVSRIARETVRSLSKAFGCRTDDLRAAIGPSIGACCYEVDDQVIDRVRELEELWASAEQPSGLRVEAAMGAPLYTATGDGKYRLNLQEINRQIMIKAGILPDHIEISQMCTSCRSDLFFSHRKEGGRTGRMIAWIGLRQQAEG